MPCPFCDGVLELSHGEGPSQFRALKCVEDGCDGGLVVPAGRPDRIRQKLADQRGTRGRAMTDGGQPDLPPGIDPSAIVTTPSEQFCEDHLETLADWEIPTLNATMEIIQVLLGLDAFYGIAYQKKNGYEFPGDLAIDDVPEGERPGNEHINQALSEAAPLCCFVEEHAENPWPDEPAPPLVAILANSAGDRRADDDELATDGGGGYRCPSCGELSDDCYRCSSCGKDLVDEDPERVTPWGVTDD